MPRRRVLVLSALATCAPVALSYSPWRSLPRSAVLTLASRERRTKARAVATGDATETAAAISEYDHTAMEAKWQQYWEAQNTFATRRREGKDKKYVLDMFPYPSGAGLHVGHPEGYALRVRVRVRSYPSLRVRKGTPLGKGPGALTPGALTLGLGRTCTSATQKGTP